MGFYLNKEGITCQLISDSGETVESVVSDDPKRHRITMTPKESMKWKIELADDAGRHAKMDSFVYITVTPNQPPTIKLTAGADRSVSPIEEWQASANIADDFGIVNHGVSFLFKRPRHETSFSNEGRKEKKLSSQQQFDMEQLRLTQTTC